MLCVTLQIRLVNRQHIGSSLCSGLEAQAVARV